MNELVILASTFASVAIITALIFNYISARSEVSARIDDSEADKIPLVIPENIRGLAVSEIELIRNYFTVTRSDNNPNSLQNRLIRAGYFSKDATKTYQLIRLFTSVFIFFLIMFSFSYFAPEVGRSLVFAIALVASAFSFFLCNIILERRGDKREIEYRKLFPDFMDTMIVCLDAGLSIEASVDRVSLEFMKSPKNRDFGLHLAIMMLEVRGGRRFRDALSNFANRLRIGEAKSLAVLFRQSEELGSSVTKTLRVFSQEMRDKRMVRAEEKANTLPLKMLFPLATFLFPMSLLIVIAPVMMKVILLLQVLMR